MSGARPELLKVAAGGAGALLATTIAHYVALPIGDAVAAVIGYSIGSISASRLAQRAPTTVADGVQEPAAAPARFAAAALALFFADRYLYQWGIHGLPRKWGAVLTAIAVLVLGVWANRGSSNLQPGGVTGVEPPYKRRRAAPERPKDFLSLLPFFSLLVLNPR